MPGLIDWDRSKTMQIDANRSIMVAPTRDGATTVLSVEDPQSIAVIELTQSEVDALVAALTGVRW